MHRGKRTHCMFPAVQLGSLFCATAMSTILNNIGKRQIIVEGCIEIMMRDGATVHRGFWSH